MVPVDRSLLQSCVRTRTETTCEGVGGLSAQSSGLRLEGVVLKLTPRELVLDLLASTPVEGRAERTTRVTTGCLGSLLDLLLVVINLDLDIAGKPVAILNPSATRTTPLSDYVALIDDSEDT